MEDLVHESNAGRLERVLVRELDMNLPYAAGERGYIHDGDLHPIPWGLRQKPGAGCQRVDVKSGLQRLSN